MGALLSSLMYFFYFMDSKYNAVTPLLPSALILPPYVCPQRLGIAKFTAILKFTDVPRYPKPEPTLERATE